MGDRFRIGRRGPLEPSDGLDFTTSLYDWWVVALLLVCARWHCAIVFFGDDGSSDSTSNTHHIGHSNKQDLCWSTTTATGLLLLPLIYYYYYDYYQRRHDRVQRWHGYQGVSRGQAKTGTPTSSKWREIICQSSRKGSYSQRQLLEKAATRDGSYAKPATTSKTS